jgi:glyoxylase-like metal-dependent hydrolase (beta-lactamase superfamily II)
MNNIVYKDRHVTVFQSALFQTNSTVVEMEDLVLVVDPAWLPDEVMAISNYVEKIRCKRELFLVFTHSDYDHIIGCGAFRPDKVFMSKAMAENPEKELRLEEVLEFDDKYYINRPYPVVYPQPDFTIFRDAAQYRHHSTKMTFYLTPGHTADSMMVVVWQIGLCIAGDYLSDVEFPVITHSSVEYEASMNKLLAIHDRNWFTRLIPGHGNLSLSINDWLQRRTESLSYIYAVREYIATGVAMDEVALWSRYHFPLSQKKVHTENIDLMRREYEQGLWTWRPAESTGTNTELAEEDDQE